MIAILIPGLYGDFVFLLPKAYYDVGALGYPPTFEKLPNWNIDLTWIDGAPEGRRLARVLSAGGTVARMSKDSYKPGRTAPFGAAPEAWGKQWNGSQCLFISSVTLALVEVSHAKITVAGKMSVKGFYAPYDLAKGEDGSYVSVDLERLRRDAGRQEIGSYFLNRLPPSAKATACLKNDQTNGPSCPRVVIWAHGDAQHHALFRCSSGVWLRST